MKKAVRLDKFLADTGAGTRSEVKKFIQKGKVQVNGVPAKKSEIKVSEEDEVVLDGNRISQAPEFVYYLLHKPAGYVSATEDKRDKTVMELVASDRKGLFPVGRLDKDTEGLLLITDDGALAHELLSPKKHVDKTYYAVTDGCMTKEDVQRFADGLEIGEKNPTMPAKLEILSTRKVEETELEQYPSGWSSEIQLTIKEGKFHQVKRMTEAVGKKVVYLKRISMGVLTLPDDLKKGECRQLTAEEEKRLISGITHLNNRIQVRVRLSENRDSKSYRSLLKLLAKNHISLDLINIFPEHQMFTIDASEKEKLNEIMNKAGIKYSIIEGCSTIAIVGAGMNGVPGVMASIINTLTSNEIEVLQTTDSNMTIWCLIYTSKVKEAIRLLHKEFNLGNIN